jgi:ParB family transcriptional regulator, chromosome partitioning protein
MGKLEALRQAAGGNVTESAARRDAAVAVGPSFAALNPARMEGVARSKAALEIPLERIERDPSQPREEFDPEALGRLADSIRSRGLLQPIRVRWDDSRGSYVLIAGERRWRAAAMAGLATMTCVVVDGEMSAAELLAVQVTENLLREDLRPVERARAFRTLMDLNGWSGNQLAKELGISQSGVVQALALLELPGSIQADVDAGALAPSVAYEVAKLPDAEAQQQVAARIVAEGLNRGEAAAAVRESARGRSKGRGASKARKATSRTLRTEDGYKVTVEHRRGVDDAGVIRALELVLGRLRGEGRGEAA